MSAAVATRLPSRAREATVVRWRTLEWWGAGFALFLFTGAIFPNLLSSGGLDESARSLLRTLALPAYAITIVLLARCPRQLVLTVRRNLALTTLLFLPFVSILWSISGSITLRRAIGLLFSVALAYLLAIRFTPRQLAALVAAVLVPLMVLSIVFAVAIPHLGRMPADAEASGVRGVFIHKNVLGWYSGLCILALLGVLFDGRFVSRRLVIAAIGVAGVCLLLSTSMTGIAATVAGVALLPFYWALRRHRGIGRTMLVLVFLQCVALLAIGLSELIVPTLEALGKDATLTGRVPLWHLVDAEIARHLILGFGYQAFWTEANPEAWMVWFKAGWQAPHAHSGFRDVLLNFGLVGFVVLAFAISRALRQGAALYCRRPEEGWLWLNLLVGWFLVLNVAESVMLVQNDFMFVLFATAILSFGLRSPERAPMSMVAFTWASPVDRPSERAAGAGADPVG